MSWLGLIGGLVSLVNALITAFANQKLIDGALAESLSAHLQKANAEILDAQNIRDTVNKRTPDELHKSDDGFFRD